MLFKKFSYILYVIILFSEIISVTIASPDCDTLAKALEYLKMYYKIIHIIVIVVII